MGCLFFPTGAAGLPEEGVFAEGVGEGEELLVEEFFVAVVVRLKLQITVDYFPFFYLRFHLLVEQELRLQVMDIFAAEI